MLLEITNTAQPATDLGYLLYKNPANVRTSKLKFGAAHVYYSEVSEERCTAALLMEINPIELLRNRRGRGFTSRALEQYVNDRPFVASSHLSVAIAEMYGTAMSGRCKGKPELEGRKLPLTARIPVLPCKGGEELLHNLFEPLEYTVRVDSIPLDQNFPEWGKSRYYRFEISGTVSVQDLLTHLYVLIPVLDNDKHYWIAKDEIEKLLTKGESWLPSHPQKELIVNRYLQYRKKYAQEALDRLADEENDPPQNDEAENEVEDRLSLNQQRIEAVTQVVSDSGATSLVDLGCGEGKYLREYLKMPGLQRILGMDVSNNTIDIAKNRLHWDDMSEKKRNRIEIIQGSLLYRDQRISGFDIATCIEVIEHMDEPRLKAFERVVFEFAKPKSVIVTTPNVEYNELFENLPEGQYRHRDHRFEWTRDQFKNWAKEICERFGYTVEISGIGEADNQRGTPTQMGVFRR
jgi:3' terminal RNA ribose 2'-O-methyltransferase Hen1